MRKRQNHF